MLDLRSLLKQHASRLVPAGAVTGVLAASLLIGPAAIIGIGTGYNYGGSACTSADVSAAPASPQNAGTAVTLTGSSTTCSHPEYQFFLQPPGGSFVGQGWQAWNGTSTATFNWPTTGLAPGTYGIGVWARNSGSTATYEVYATATYKLLGNCIQAQLADSTGGASAPGTAVTFTASAPGCPNPSFRFWALVPGRSSWVMIQDYSSSNTFNWTGPQTSGSPEGTYQIGVWARQAGSTNSYDAYTIITHVLKKTSCDTAAISASPASPSKSAAVTVTGTAAGCTGALFQFWTRNPSGTWTILQAYSTTATATFNAATATNGQWQLGVWVKDPASSNSYDSYAIITYFVGS